MQELDLSGVQTDLRRCFACAEIETHVLHELLFQEMSSLLIFNVREEVVHKEPFRNQPCLFNAESARDRRHLHPTVVTLITLVCAMIVVKVNGVPCILR
jgi:hypothetical protein